MRRHVAVCEALAAVRELAPSAFVVRYVEGYEAHTPIGSDFGIEWIGVKTSPTYKVTWEASTDVDAWAHAPTIAEACAKALAQMEKPSGEWIREVAESIRKARDNDA